MDIKDIELHVEDVLRRVRGVAMQNALHVGKTLSDEEHAAFTAVGALVSAALGDLHRIANALEHLASPAPAAVQGTPPSPPSPTLVPPNIAAGE